MYHVFCRQVVAPRDLRFAGLAAVELPAFFQEAGACGSVDGAVNPASAE